MKDEQQNFMSKVVKKDEHVKSEEVQAIIDRMPTYWVKWVVLCVSVLIAVLIVLSFVIQYPDTVNGQISITAQVAPVRLVANTNARIHLIKGNKCALKKGDVIAFLENGADYTHVLQLDTLLKKLQINHPASTTLPETLILGEVSSSYNSFALSYAQYERLRTSDIYQNMRQNLQKQIEADEAVITNVKNEVVLKNRVLKNSHEQLKNDSLLRTVNGLSEQDYKKQYNEHLSLQESKLGLQSSQLLKQSEISKNRLELQRILLQETEEKEKAFSELVSRKNELLNAIQQWKERYLLYSPIDGELEYLGFWRNNTFVKSGEELFTVIPPKNEVVGEVMISAVGAGKVKVGQTANLKIDKFPYDEYGLIRGVVKSVSRLTNKVQTEKGTSDAYLVLIAFPNGLVTNFGQSLALDFETKGSAEIITKRKRLIERLFDNLKSRGEK